MTKIWIFDTFVLALCEPFGVKQPQKWLLRQPQKLVKVKQQLLINPLVWYFHHEMHTGSFIGHLWTKSSMKITFHRSQKCISPIWVGFVKQSIGILWLLYQLLHAIKWFLGLNNWNGPVIPGRIGHVQKTSIWTQPLVKSREIQFLNFSLLWRLETTIFSQPYPFLWLSCIWKQTT